MDTNYSMPIGVRQSHLELIDIPTIVAACKERWFNQILTRINDSVARIGIVEGEYHWHKHDNDDEFFFVLLGKLFIDLEGSTIELEPMQGITIPMRVLHRTRAPQKTVMLMLERMTLNPSGD